MAIREYSGLHHIIEMHTCRANILLAADEEQSQRYIDDNKPLAIKSLFHYMRAHIFNNMNEEYKTKIEKAKDYILMKYPAEQYPELWF